MSRGSIVLSSPVAVQAMVAALRLARAEVGCLYCGLGIREPEIQRRKEVSE